MTDRSAPPDDGKRETVNHFHIGINTLQCPVCNPGDPGAIGVPFYFDPAPRKPEAQTEIVLHRDVADTPSGLSRWSECMGAPCGAGEHAVATIRRTEDV